jgi:ABC-type transport system involved in multi-copper enzyme maturation permease subunit
MAVMIAAFAAVSWMAGAPLSATHAAAFLLIAVELVVMTAIATLFSSFTTPMLASFFSGSMWIAGNLTRHLRDLGATSELEVVRGLTLWLYRILPDLEGFDLTIEAAHGLPIAGSDVWLAVVYGGAYAALVLVLGVMIFERRDLR